MQIHGASALVTGANRGLGRHIAQQLRDGGATVYAGARDVRSIDLDGVIPLALDITKASSIAAAAAATQGVSILVNNAGTANGAGLLNGDLDQIRSDFDTNFFGTLAVTRAFAPQLGQHPQSSVLNVLSVLSWFSIPTLGGYSASKSAQWSLTNGIRQELAPQGTRVGALHVGWIDTDLAAGVDGPKLDPAAVAQVAVEAIESGAAEVLADEVSAQVRAGLAAGAAALYPGLA